MEECVVAVIAAEDLLVGADRAAGLVVGAIAGLAGSF